MFVLYIDLAMNPDAYLLMARVSISDRVSVSVRPRARAVVEVNEFRFTAINMNSECVERDFSSHNNLKNRPVTQLPFHQCYRSALILFLQIVFRIAEILPDFGSEQGKQTLSQLQNISCKRHFVTYRNNFYVSSKKK